MQTKLINKTVILSCLLAIAWPVCAENSIPQTDEDKKVFRKFHPDGVVEFSDQPTKGSEELKMEELPTYKFAPTTPAAPTPKLTPHVKPIPARAAATPSGPYNSLKITKPGQNETLRSNNGDVDVQFSLAPTLQFYLGHQLEYLLDGKSILKTRQVQMLKNIDRGSHSLVIRVIDKHNKVLIHSDPVNFHVKRFVKPPAKAASPTPKATL